MPNDRFGAALAVAKAKYGPRKVKPWGAIFAATALTLGAIGFIVVLLIANS